MKLVLLFLFAISAANAASLVENDGNSIIYHLKPGPAEDRIPVSERKYKNLNIFKSPAVEVNQFNEGKIVGGSYAWDTLLPYQAAVTMHYGNGWYGICGGTIIGNEWIVTAAHCVDGGAQSIEVGLGSVNRDNALRTTWAYTIYIAGGWNPNNLNADIALLKVQRFDYNERIAPADLPARNGQYTSYVNNWVTTSGWGGTNDNGEFSNILKYADMVVAANSVCSNSYGSDLGTNSFVCVASKGQSTCSGDSGGPLVIKNTRLLIGVTSYVAAAGCTLNFPMGFTRITTNIDWIYSVTGLSW